MIFVKLRIHFDFVNKMTAQYMASTSVKYDDWLKNFDSVENRFADSKKYGITVSGTNAKQGGAGMNVEQAKKRDHKIYITDVAIQKVPLVRVKGMLLVESEMLQREHMEILRIAKEQNDINEVLSVLDLSSGVVARILGTESGASPFNNAVSYSMIINAKRHGLGVLHNHPSNNNFSLADLYTFMREVNRIPYINDAMTDDELKKAFAELRNSTEEAVFRPKENSENMVAS